MDGPPEFAEQYSTTERIRFVVVGAASGALLAGAGTYWLFPWLREVSASAQCRTLFGNNGATLLLYGLFVGVPLVAALVIACTFGRRGFRILRDGQLPPLREKSFRPTRIRRGSSARRIGHLHVMAFMPFIAIALWGCFQATALSRQAAHTTIGCAADHPIKPKPSRDQA
jgi:hypothetical protein